MNKKLKLALNESLDKALEPPKKKKQNLDTLLDQYQDQPYPTQPNVTQPNPTQPDSIKSNQTEGEHQIFTDVQRSTATAATDEPWSNETYLEVPVSPVRNFTKVPNSIKPDLFRGTSQKTYTTLYNKTRGAVVPRRTLQLRKKDLAKAAAVSVITLDKHLSYLRSINLINWTHEKGNNDGAIYEIFIPEEVVQRHLTSPNVTSPNTTSPNLLLPDIPSPKFSGERSPLETEVGSPKNLGGGSVSQVTQNTSFTESDNTSLNTSLNTSQESDDDENLLVFKQMNQRLLEVTQELTSRQTNVRDAGKWLQIAEILAAQLEMIASRTAISNAPAVLAEHLHRQLNSKRALEKMGLITPSEARGTKEVREPAKSKEEIKDLYLCPDCFGTTFWNPDGKGRRPNCPHHRLEEAREKAKSDVI